jgi:Relaxase/Mobilisation nuclease domain
MIVHIFQATKSFGGVSYNTNKIDRNKGELMRVANFGPLQGLGKLRPQDYVNYLEMITGLNKNVKKPQFHAVISAKGKACNQHSLTVIAEAWLKEMGYGKQPYLIVFHKDTDNNHVHLVSTRIDRDGAKISSGFEKRRAIKNLNKVLGFDYGFGYKFSTRAQFFLLLEKAGYLGTDPMEALLQQKINNYKADKERAAEIKAILQQTKHAENYVDTLKQQYKIDLIFHASEGKEPYGYTIIDHEHKMVFKGSEVYPLKELRQVSGNAMQVDQAELVSDKNISFPAYIQSISISDDVDDQQIHGMRRRRQKKARTNTR